MSMNRIASLWFPATSRLMGRGVVGDPAYRAPVQCSNVHGNGEGLNGDAQLGSQGRVQKALIGTGAISTGSPTAKWHEKGCE